MSKSPSTLANSSRPSRFPSFAPMPPSLNSVDRTQQQGLPSTFPYPSPGAWSIPGLGGLSRNRDATVAARGPLAPDTQLRTEATAPAGYSEASNAFGVGSSGMGSLAATPDADVWGSRVGAWSSTDTTQPTTLSANTSPRSRSDVSVHDVNSAYATAASGMPRSRLAPKPNGLAGMDSVSAAFHNAAPPNPPYGSELEGFNPFGRSARQESEHRRSSFLAAYRRPPQESSFSAGTANGPPRNSVSGHAAPDSLAEFALDTPAAPYAHSQRASLAGPSAYDPRTMDPGVAAVLADQDALAASLTGLTMDGGRNGHGHNASTALGYANGVPNFSFNPGSQPWAYGGQGYGSYANAADRRGSKVDRSSPAGSNYHVNGGPSNPASVAGASSMAAADAWSRPGSRDPRMNADIDRRALTQFLQQAPVALFSGGPFYGPNYQHYAQIYPPFGDTLPPVPVGDLAMPMPHYPVSAANAAGFLSRNEDAGKALRSAVLHEYKFGPKAVTKHWELKDIAGYIVEFSTDQGGSRFIQEKLEVANGDEKEQVFREIATNAVGLMRDLFGNYVIQKFFEHGDQIQKKVLLNAMKGKLADLSVQMYSCRVVQKAMENVLVEQQAEMVKELEADLMRVTKDVHGNHVIQQAIAIVPRQHIGFIVDAFIDRAFELSSHIYGCRVIQRLLEHGTEADMATLTKELLTSAALLASDAYGNYVIQHMLEHGKVEDRSTIIDIVMPNLLTLSRNKFASNVVEKCIAYGTQEEQGAIIDRILGNGDINSPFFQFARDQFGNYVVQTLITTLAKEGRFELVLKLEAQLSALGWTGKPIGAIETVFKRVKQEYKIETPASATPESTAPVSPAQPASRSSGTNSNSPVSTTPSNPSAYGNGDAVQLPDQQQAAPAGKGIEPAPSQQQ